MNEPPRRRAIAIQLALFLGLLGAHRFYLGKTWSGLAMLLTLGGFGVWWVVDIVRLLFLPMRDTDGYTIGPPVIRSADLPTDVEEEVVFDRLEAELASLESESAEVQPERSTA